MERAALEYFEGGGGNLFIANELEDSHDLPHLCPERHDPEKKRGRYEV